MKKLKERTSFDKLFIESFSCTPHLETSAEIAIEESLRGAKVGFVFIHTQNLDDDSRFQPVANYQKILRFSYQQKVKKVESILALFGVEIVADSPLSSRRQTLTASFAKSLPYNIQALKKYEYCGASLGMGVVSSLISRSKTECIDVKKDEIRIKALLQASAEVYEKTLHILNRYSVKSVVTFNGRFACSKPICEAAKHLEIAVEYHERGATYERYNVFTESPHNLAHVRKMIGEFAVQEELKSRSSFHEFFTRRRKGDGIGWVSFTADQRNFSLPDEMGETKKKIITFFSTSDFEYACVEGATEGHLFLTQREAIQWLISWVDTRSEEVLLCIRLHPNLGDSPDQHWWLGLKSSNVIVIEPRSIISSYDLLDISDKIVTYGSTIGIEATYWGKPSINLANALYSGLNCVHEPRTKEELSSLLLNAIHANPQENCAPYGLYFLYAGYQHRFYKPHNLFDGELCGKQLTAEPIFIERLKAMKKGMKQFILKSKK
jgi:hypothetical protein